LVALMLTTAGAARRAAAAKPVLRAAAGGWPEGAIWCSVAGQQAPRHALAAAGQPLGLEAWHHHEQHRHRHGDGLREDEPGLRHIGGGRSSLGVGVQVQ
jgi:hypothetical protein